MQKVIFLAVLLCWVVFSDTADNTARKLGVSGGANDAEFLYKKACDNGEMAGCVRLGELYASRKTAAKNSLDRDYTIALDLFDKACDNNEMEGCYHLAEMYKAGQGARQDVPLAYEIHQKACEGGEPRSCQALGNAYKYGYRGKFKKDLKQAKVFYGKACDLRYQRGCREYAKMK